MIEIKYEITFIPQYVNNILDGEKWLTVRHGMENPPEEDEELIFTETGNYERFAEAKTKWVTDMTIREFVNKDWEGHVNYRNPQHMIWALKRFYPDANLRPDTEITLIGFKVTRELQ